METLVQGHCLLAGLFRALEQSGLPSREIASNKCFCLEPGKFKFPDRANSPGPGKLRPSATVSEGQQQPPVAKWELCSIRAVHLGCQSGRQVPLRNLLQNRGI